MACENKGSQAGYVAIKAVENVNHKNVRDFVNKRISESQRVHTDALVALNIIGEKHEYEKHATSSGKVDQWLPCVHITDRQFKSIFTGYIPGCVR